MAQLKKLLPSTYMKNLKTVIVLLLIAASWWAQAQTNAILALENQDYKIAKDAIDKYFTKNAATIATNPKEAKAWYYKGRIYHILATSEDTKLRSLVDADGLKTAAEAYAKASELDATKNKEWKTKSDEQLNILHAVFFNEGIAKYQQEDFTGAVDNMKMCQKLKPEDTLAYTVGASLGIQAKDFAFAKDSYNKLISMGYKNISYYKNLLYIALEEEKNNDEAMNVIQAARKEFPENATFMAQEVNLYINTGRKQEAISKLEEAVNTDAANAKLYLYNLGILYKQTNDNVKAKDYFKKSLDLDPNYGDSNYMFGFMLMEEGDAVNKKINMMPYKEWQAKGKQEEAKRDNLYKSAIPYLEKAYAESKEPELKNQLITLYKKFNMNDKIKALN